MNALTQPLARVLERAPASWAPIVERWRASAAGHQLLRFVDERRAAGATIFPDAVLRALEMTPRAQVRVVILGQDPYHGPGQAEGLAFSVPVGQRVPPSLRNVFQELARDLGLAPSARGHLGAWARQGVLLLNTVLTVEAARPGSHAGQGWEALTDEIIESIAGDGVPRVFMLWGAQAQAKRPAIEARGGHAVLCANHPSPLSARRGPVPFFGCGHFSSANRFLAAHGAGTIDWSLAHG